MSIVQWEIAADETTEALSGVVVSDVARVVLDGRTAPTVREGDQAALFDAVLGAEELNEFWEDDEAVAPTRRTIQNALEFLNAIIESRASIPTKITTSPRGSIVFEWYFVGRGDLYEEAEISDSPWVTWVREAGGVYAHEQTLLPRYSPPQDSASCWPLESLDQSFSLAATEGTWARE